MHKIAAKLNLWLIAALLVGVSLLTSSPTQCGIGEFNAGDWANYTVFRYVTSVAADQGVVYFGTTGGIIRYDRFANRWLYPLTTTGGLPSNVVENVAYDPVYNELWASTSRGVAKYSIAFETWYPEFDFPADLAKNDWRAQQFPSLFVPFGYSYDNGLIEDSQFRQYGITSGFEDVNDLMYIGTWGLGPGVVNTRHLDLQLTTYGPYNYNISRVFRLGDDLWMGNDLSRSERGITRYDLRAEEWEYFDSEQVAGLGSANVMAAIVADNSAWLGTTAGLLKVGSTSPLRLLSLVQKLPSEDVQALAVYGGFLYVGTDNGLAVLTSTGIVPDSAFKIPLTEEYLLRGQGINDLLEVRGSLYIATSERVFMFNADSSMFRELDTPTHDLAYGANDIFYGGKTIYFAARFGVVEVDLDTEEATLATDPSYSDRWRLNDVYADKDHIWAASSVGLWRYRRSDQNSRMYTVDDGLPTNYINSLVMDNDYLWLGTAQGLVRFYWNDPDRAD